MRLPRWLTPLGDHHTDFTSSRRRVDHEFYPDLALTELEERRVLAVDSVTPIGDVSGVDEGIGIALTVATFTDDTGTGNTPHTAEINWGDSTSNSGAVTEPTGMAEGQVAGTHVYAEDGVYTVVVTVTGDDMSSMSDSFRITVDNVDPLLTSLKATQEIPGNGLVKLTGTFTDPGILDTHTLIVSWGDGAFAGGPLFSGVRDFSLTHVYADSNPAATGYTINIFLSDDDGGTEFASVMPVLKNVAPKITNLSVTSMINEDGTVTLTGTYTDADALDTFTLDVDWGSGETSDTVTLGVGVRDFTITHQYLDDNPTITTQDSYTITATVTDDEGDSDTETVATLVKNVDPLFTALSVTPMIDENGVVTLSGTFTDPGTLDTYSLVVDWGLGETSDTITLAAGVRDFILTHQYKDDNPTVTTQDDYTITLTLTDDDSGDETAALMTTVKNVAPVLTVVDRMVAEGSLLTLVDLGTYTDVGMFDTHTAKVNWGDGAPTESAMVTGGMGTGSITGVHTYAMDGVFTVIVMVVDDDGGTASGSFLVTVAARPIFIPPTPPTPTPPDTPTPNSGSPSLISVLGLEVQTSRNAQTQLFETGEDRGSSSLPDIRKGLGDLVATSEKRFLLREVFANGTEGESIPLQDDAVNDLPVLYSKLPDGHYRIYQLREDGTLRLVADEYIVKGRPVDPNDQGGSQDRPPTSSLLPSGDQQVAMHLPDGPQVDVPGEQAEVMVIEEFQSRASRRLLAGLSVAGAGAIALTDRGSWQSRMDRAMQRYQKRPTGKASRLLRTRLPR